HPEHARDLTVPIATLHGNRGRSAQCAGWEHRFDASAAPNRSRPVTTATTDTRHQTLRYLPGLDGLRAISVLAVIVFHHYLVGGHEVGWAPGGFLGVEVFFVVSGYLITSLLLNERRETGRVSMKSFYL